MNFILYGYKRCGKTHFGKLLSQEAGREFVDSDLLIEGLYFERYHEKKGCRSIHIERGDLFFRKLEKEVFLSLKGRDNLIISIGGGGVLDIGSATILKEIGSLIYLELDKTTLKERLLKGNLAPYLQGCDPELLFEQMYAHRKPIYEKLAKNIVNLSGKSEKEVLNELLVIVRGEKKHGQ